MTENCIFCQIAQKKSPAFIIDENEQYMAFLDIFPNTDGMTLVIPKKHFDSYAFQMPDQALAELMQYSKKIALRLDKAFEDVGRTGMVMEGFGVNHVHIKLYPLHGTKQDQFEAINSNDPTFIEKYRGYITSKMGPKADFAHLEKILKKIKETK